MSRLKLFACARAEAEKSPVATKRIECIVPNECFSEEGRRWGQDQGDLTEVARVDEMRTKRTNADAMLFKCTTADDTIFDRK